MPELPEVETIRAVLEPQLEGMGIKDVILRHPGVIAHPDAGLFRATAAGRHITGLGRRGKFLTMELGDGMRVIIHLRMTGCLLVTPPGFPEEKHTHVVIILSDGREIRFSDTRRFGRLWLIRSGEEDIYSGMMKLGPEPFSTELSGSYLREKLGRSSRAIKEGLMDQRVVAGIGNIYSDEILFHAGIHPAMKCSSLTDAGWERLSKIIPERLSFFTEANRITADEYLRTKGKEYRNTPFIGIYGHEGKPCPICGTPLERTVIGGRGSTYCPACQREEG